MEYQNFGASNALAHAAQLGGLQSTKPETPSDAVLNRLRRFRESLSETRSLADVTANKILGAIPTAVNNGMSAVERGPSNGFLDAISDLLNDLERIGGDTHDHIRRINNAF